MKLWKIFSFEIAYQARHVSTWFYFLLLLGITFIMAREVFIDEAQVGGFFLNAPFAVAQVTLVACIMGLLSLSAIAGGAAARDVETRMHPILYSAPIGKASYIGGRFLATFTLGALMMSAIPIGLLCAALFPGDHGDLIGPIRASSYLSAYFLLALPNAFIAMALMFSAAAFGRRGVVSYLGGIFIFFAAVVSWQFVAVEQGYWDLGKITDPLGLTVLGELSKLWTNAQKNTLLVGLQLSMLSNRLIWLGVALCILALTYFRFRFAHLAESTRWWRIARGRNTLSAMPASSVIAKVTPLTFPQVRQAFGPATSALQVLAIVRESFQLIVKGWGGIGFAALAAFVILIAPLSFSSYYSIPELPTTGQLVGLLENTGDHGMWLIIPLLIIYYAGELVWRERDARMNEIIGAAPMPVWVSFAGKFAGLTLALIAMQALLMIAGMLIQLRLGYYEFEVGVYVQVLFGIRLTDYLLFALLAFFLHVVINQKYVAHLIAAIAYLMVVLGPQIGIEHGPHVYGSDLGWSYSDIRGLDPFLGPWLLFKLYWTAWALLLGITALLLWPQGKEQDLRHRLRVAGSRFTRKTALTAAVALVLMLTFGGMIVYNMYVLDTSETYSSGEEEWRAEYERRYGRFVGIPQPRATATSLHVEIYPERRVVEIRGTYHLVNKSGLMIDSIHVATALGGETRSVGLNLPLRNELVDEKLGHRIFVLEKPLSPGDSLRLEFEVSFDPPGFSRKGIDPSVAQNGTHFGDWLLPRMGYQRSREFREAKQRQIHGLTQRPEIPPLDDTLALMDVAGQERVKFEAVVGTDEEQIAVAPGTLRRTWTQNGRRYFHYVTDAPIKSKFGFFSAAYAVREGRWNDIEIQVLHHPGHTLNVDRIIRGVQASLDYLTRQFGAYPHRQIRFVEVPGNSPTLYAYPTNVYFQEGFAILKADEDPRGVDLPFAIVAHEVAHHWWGKQLAPAEVGGAALLTETLAWHSALEVVEATHGREHFEGILSMARKDYLAPRTRAADPLLWSIDRLQYYRKGPLAMYALREYIGKEQVNGALRRLLEKHAPGITPLSTPLDLYRELQAATPDSLQYLVHDLFAANTFWDFETESATARKTKAGNWQVTLDVQARKMVIDAEGVEKDVPLNDWVQIGLFAPAKEGGESTGPLYLEMHRIRSGRQKITVKVPGKPAHAGIDPGYLLFDWEMANNLKEVTIVR
ncbi:putative membrane protein [Flammeovirgaceae bacterium 311]|nr:putative membrane protein [Flammeovirgaceae bacterium 311]